MSHSLLEHPKYRRWKNRVEANGSVFKKIDILSIISRDQGSFYGAFLDCLLLTPEGFEIPRCVVIRGESAVIVPVLKCRDDGEVYTLMVEQRRIVDGDYSQEFPAGTVDSRVEDSRAMACQEIQEELDLVVLPQELILLAPEPVKISPDLTDDLAYFFYFEKEVSQKFLEEMEGRNTGCENDFEHIRVRVRKMSEVCDVFTASVLIGLKLLERALGEVF